MAQQQLTQQEKEKIFAMYVFSDGISKMWHTQMGWQYTDVFKIIQDKDKVDEVFHGNSDPEINFWKLALTPLSAISDEDAREIAKVFGNLTTDNPDESLLEYGRSVVELCMQDVRTYQYLISKSYAVPLWFGVDHPNNGLTAIECGVAIDKTK